MHSARNRRELVMKTSAGPPTSASESGKSELNRGGDDSVVRRPRHSHRTTAPRAGEGENTDWSALMARAQDGDRGAYRRLLRDITPYLRTLAARKLDNPADVEDAVQEVLLAIHEIRHTYDPARPFGPWLATIARYRLVDRIRREERNRAKVRKLATMRATSDPGETNKPDETEEHGNLSSAIDMLPPGQREAIRLLKLEELTLKQAALQSGLSVGALKAATHRAMLTLRKLLATGND